MSYKNCTSEREGNKEIIVNELICRGVTETVRNILDSAILDKKFTYIRYSVTFCTSVPDYMAKTISLFSRRINCCS